MSEHNPDYTIKNIKIHNEFESEATIVDKNGNEFIGYMSDKSISVIQVFSPTDESVKDHKPIIKFLREFKETCQS